MTPAIAAGFECARLESQDYRCLLTADGHRPEERMAQHYAILTALGVRLVRDGLPPWLDMAGRLRVAREAGVSVIWDVDHYWRHHDPNAYARRVIEAVQGEEPRPFRVCFNETSFAPVMCPGLSRDEVLRAARVILDALRRELPDVRLVTSEPAHHPGDEEHHAPFADEAEVLGLNIYPHELSRPIEEVLWDTAARYPNARLAITETSLHRGHFWRRRRDLHSPGMTKGQWLDHVLAAVDRSGVPVEFVCLYPAINGVNWTNGHLRCDNGLIRPDLSTDPDLAMAILRATSAAPQWWAA